MLLLLCHCLQRLLIAPWDEVFLWSNHWMFSSHYLSWVFKVIFIHIVHCIDHIILPFFVLGTFYRKVSLLITTEILSCDMSFYSWRECSSFFFLAWFVRDWLSSLLQSILHLFISDLPTRTTLSTEFGRPFKVVIYAFASLTLSSTASNRSLRCDLLVK